MKIIRYLLSHIVLIGVIVALILGFYYRDYLFTEQVNASIDDSVSGLSFWRAQKDASQTQGSSVEGQTSDVATERPATAETRRTQADEYASEEGNSTGTARAASDHGMPGGSMPDDEPADEIGGPALDTTARQASGGSMPMGSKDEPQGDAAAAEESQAPPSERGIAGHESPDGQLPQSETVIDDTTATNASPKAAWAPDVATKDEAGAEDTTDIQQPMHMAAAEQASNAQDQGTDQQLDTTDGTQRGMDEASETASQRANRLIRRARQAYQQGNMAEAEAYYRRFIDNAPQDPNAHGELGNVYYQQGKWEQAGKAYYEAAVRLLAIGETAQVQYLLRIIQGLHPQSAKKLQQMMTGQ